MCIIGNAREFVSVGGSNMAPVVPSLPNSSSNSNFVQIMKPKLPRRVTRTPRINLNKYWNILEDMMTEGSSSSSSSSSSSTVSNSAQVTCFEDVDMNNEINENISNEQKEVNYITVNNERNARTVRESCECNLCLISNLRNISVSAGCEDVTEL